MQPLHGSKVELRRVVPVWPQQANLTNTHRPSPKVGVEAKLAEVPSPLTMRRQVEDVAVPAPISEELKAHGPVG